MNYSVVNSTRTVLVSNLRFANGTLPIMTGAVSHFSHMPLLFGVFHDMVPSTGSQTYDTLSLTNQGVNPRVLAIRHLPEAPLLNLTIPSFMYPRPSL